MTGWCGPDSSRSGQGSVTALFYPVHRGNGACTQEVTACSTLASLPSLADQVVLKVVNQSRDRLVTTRKLKGHKPSSLHSRFRAQ